MLRLVRTLLADAHGMTSWCGVSYQVRARAIYSVELELQSFVGGDKALDDAQAYTGLFKTWDDGTTAHFSCHLLCARNSRVSRPSPSLGMNG